ncbi:MAG: DUF6789 family protein [Kofleriaceae bacterium]|nr:DUF6789 family protein [Kofleriaceae bacterium]
MTLTSSRFWRGAMYGVIGTIAMSVVMTLLHVTNVLPATIYISAITRMFAIALGERGELPAAALALAVPFYLAYGAIWAGLAAITTPQMTWWKGAVLGVGLWIIQMMFVVPFSAENSWAPVYSAKIWVGTLLMHLAYGITTGALMEKHEPLEAHATSLG